MTNDHYMCWAESETEIKACNTTAKETAKRM